MNKLKLTFLSVSILFVMSSCVTTLLKVAGIHEIKSFNAVEYQKKSDQLTKKYPGQKVSFAISDTSSVRYSALFDSIYPNFSLQPIQILYFDKQRKLVSYHTNCLAPGSINKLNWNHEQRLEQYFPKSAADVSHETWTLDDLIQKVGLSESTIPRNKDVVVFMWSNMLKREINNANSTMISNIVDHLDKKDYPFIIYLNVDKLLASSYNDALTQEFLQRVLTESEYNKHPLNKKKI
ncbi:hypothetical protein ACFSQ3_07040 [Sphingobacterium corticis]|uniref:Lipoprotein n=1 Tax=Sphingobacterium corticis TaxID=1812823 RepID=A0ABW5NHV3_9SPHI